MIPIPTKDDLDFKFDDSFKVGTAPDLDPFKDNFPVSSFCPIWNFNNRGNEYFLKKPLKVKIYFEDNLWFVENETLIVISTGNSYNDALDDFYSQIVYFHDYYKELSRDKVTADAILLKNEYENLY